MAAKNTADIGFEKQIWDAACVLRGNLDASEYKSVVLGLIFLKYISDRFDEKYKALKKEGEGFEEDTDEYTSEGIFFVPSGARWNEIAAKAHTPEIGTVIDDAMRAIEKENKRLKDILPKNFARPELDKRRLGDVVDLFTNIQMIEHGSEKDILGRTYEYCLSMFAEQEGKRGGEFFTPSCVVRTLVEVLKPYGGKGGKSLSLKEINAQINELLKAAIQSEGVISLFDSSKTGGESFSLFDPAVLDEISRLKEKNIAVEILKKLMAEQVSLYKRTNVVQSQKFSEKIARLMNSYYNGLITNEEVIKELLKTAEEISNLYKNGQKLGLSQEELAFYDALTKPEHIKDFYQNEELIEMTKELTEMLRKNRTIDWQKKETARASMRKMVKRLLKRHKYPPEDYDYAINTVLRQCELWTDHVEMPRQESKIITYSFGQEQELGMVAEEITPYGEKK